MSEVKSLDIVGVDSRRLRRGLIYGMLGVVGFSQTLTATRFAVQELDPVLVGLGRVCLAALPAALLLLLRPAAPLTRDQWWRLWLVAVGVVLLFPLLSAMAMEALPAAHGAVLVALLPLVTALMARLRGGERPSLWYWLTAAAGSLLVMGFALRNGGGALQMADLVMLLAIVGGGMGYAEGGALAREIGGWRVICWALLLGAPFALAGVWIMSDLPQQPVSPAAWLALLYVALISQLLGFFAWYQGLALGGVARISQLQLLMPFLTLLGAALLLNEQVDPDYFLFAAAVTAMVGLNRRSLVAHAPHLQVNNR
jgi:drug/metabolite transporter (DMT)-like permease